MAPSRAPFICLECARAARSRLATPSARAFTTATHSRARNDVLTDPYPEEQLPRWKRTPPAMAMPVRVRARPNQPEWKVNSDPDLLDEMYDRFIGRAGTAAKDQVKSTRGRDLLPEEIKWLAITHKSFDHARRGSNDRLAFLGKRLIDLQASLSLLNMPAGPRALRPPPRDEVYQHEALQGIENITASAKYAASEKTRVARLATSYGIDKVMRWRPKKSENLAGSGVDTVAAHTLYSIIGALALQRGGEVATAVVRERVLKPLGLR